MTKGKNYKTIKKTLVAMSAQKMNDALPKRV